MRTITFVRENITVQVPQDTTVMEAASKIFWAPGT